MRNDVSRAPFLFAAMLLMLAGTVHGQNEPRLLYPLDRLEDTGEATTHTAEEERRVREAVFGDHVSGYMDCSREVEDSVGETKFVAPEAATVRGSFIEPESVQTAYLFRYQTCSSGRSYTSRVVLVEDDTVVHDFGDQADAFLSAAAVDLDGDGVDEIVHVIGYLGMGQWSEWVWLSSMKDGVWKTLFVHEVGGDTCGAHTVVDPGVVVDVRVTYETVPGEWPRFSMTREISPCEDDPADFGVPSWWEEDLAEALDLSLSHPQAAALAILRVARRGYPLAQLEVGRMYAQGLGLPRDLELAEMWLQAAAEGGVEEAREELRSVR